MYIQVKLCNKNQIKWFFKKILPLYINQKSLPKIPYIPYRVPIKEYYLFIPNKANITSFRYTKNIHLLIQIFGLQTDDLLKKQRKCRYFCKS